MNPLPNSEQLQIQRLRALLKSKEQDLELARQQISQLKSSAHQPQSTLLSSPDITEHSTDAHGDIQLSAVSVNHRVVSPGNTGSKCHSRRHVDSRASQHQYQNGDEPYPYAVKRPRTMSQQAPSSQKMDRAASNLSIRSAGPFTGNTPVSPLPAFQPTKQQARYTEQGNYIVHGSQITSQPISNLIQQQVPVGNQHQQHGMFTLADMGSLPTGVLVDPAVWLAAHEDASSDFITPFSGTSYPGDMDAPNPNMSVCGSMTSCPTYDNTAPMTRQNSQFDSPSIAGGVRMIEVGSQMSHGQDTYSPSQQALEYDESYLGKPSSHEDALFAVGSSLETFTRESYASSTPNDGLLVSPDMERSLSSTSVASAKSTSSSLSARAKVTLKAQNHRALNAPLKPKPSIDESKAEPPLDEKNDGKAAITKTKYVRPRQPKVFCDLCDEHREGFRGEHELRRHKDAKHQMLVKKFICVDPQELGLPVNVQVVNPLSKCKACKAQKKYGAYYNAAAHLRRTHFKEKPSRCKNKNAGTNGADEDKRGGKGGGDWPSMHELKNWMREIYVRQDEQQPKEEDDIDEEIDSVQPYFGEGEVSPNIAATSSSSFGSPGIANLDYNFANPITINAMNVAGLAYMEAMPLSSADFSFNGPTNMPLAFNADVTAFSTIDHMNPLSSALSSSATVTPLTVFNDTQQHQFDEVSYQYTA
ncbi:hypothetical protein F5B22DRAFT_204210 [Xylaria bambusicola]|uniref:uncharacterized protein n=1 Tax=Xylaria bambusicola TaxID=326684 RepID=UPI002008914A|nr:uncharacterized protein F5B22DRAFT_204210 [Xylaria bambusicola]KAI0515151.1 hypothetical protein F5B22DRAFT_204210 [Xylaria bambusicola]